MFKKEDPYEIIAQKQVSAYNAHDIEAFMSLFTTDAEIRSFPTNQIILQGYDGIQEFYTNHRFNLNRLRADIVHRMIIGNLVIDHEQIFGMGQPGVVEQVAIYQVENEKIKTVWLIQDQRADPRSMG